MKPLSSTAAALIAERKGYRMPLEQSGSAPHSLVVDDLPSPAAYAGLLLYLGDWEGAHQVAQSIDSSDGSYWHAIIHRQEPDAGNSLYWFRQAGNHPIFPALREEAAAILHRHPAIEFELDHAWNPSAFIDLCDSASEQPNSELAEVAIEIQHAEWRLLFDWCSTSR